MIILPAIDIKDGKCVRLRQGEARRVTVFYDDPVEPALKWAEAGAQWLHVVDLDGAFGERPTNIDVFRRIAARVDIPFEVGGGIRTLADIRLVLEAGASRAIVGTKAVQEAGFLEKAVDAFPGKIALGIDAREGMIATRGWTETSSVSVFDLLVRLKGLDLSAVIYTDIAKDGMMAGPNIEMTRRVAEATGHPVIASGGVSSLDDIRKLAKLPLWGAIVGRALYDGAFTVQEALEASE
jgi:phosphoribosylformimino-5-aminoimidazole carboxamide ribotide isomerase